ncbi:MAG TPA: XrtA system polysaccharide chain length determinant [Acetobacteraceae bacterium]|nr:XrtA system polysaccharide chain length determinant [Acetobacteraceae bacterium]
MWAQLITEARRYAKAAWRHRWKGLALAWVVCLAGWVVVYKLPDRYQASARIYADADAILGQVLRDLALDSSPAQQVELLQRTLLSRPNLERVVARTDLDLRIHDAYDREDLLQDLARSIRIQAQTRNLFSISFADHDPRLAQSVVQVVLNLFMEQATTNDRQQMENARNFVNQQIAVYERQLREAEQRRADFRANYLELLPDGPAGGTGLEAARNRLRQLRGELQDTQLRGELIRRQVNMTPQSLPADAVGPGGETRLAEAERTLRELRLRFTDQHPAVIEQRSIIADLRASGTGGAPARGGDGSAASRGTGPRANPLYEQLRLRLVDVEATLVSLNRQIGEEAANVERLEAMLRSMPQVQAQFQNLDRDYNVLRRNYEELLERRESVQIAGAARTGAERVRLDVVDPPTVPPLPSGPNRILLASAVLVVGLGAGGALAVLLVLLDSSFFTAQDLRRIGLPVIGAVSALDPAPRQGFAIVAFAGGLLLLIGAYGVALLGGPRLVARVPELLARFFA